MHLGLGALIGLALGIGQGVAAPGDNPNKPTTAAAVEPAPVMPGTAKPGKPILTKSGRKAALKDAAAAIGQAPGATLRAAPAATLQAVAPAAATNPTDQTKVPHYFRPLPELGAEPPDGA